MKYQAVIGKILNVHPKDLRTVMPMLVLIFFAGLGLSSAFNSINVALIKNHGAHSLPQIYIISGILLACFSYLYALLEQKLGPAKLFSWVLVSIGIWALGTFAMFQYGANEHLYILLQPQVRSSLNKQLRHSNSLIEFISILKLLNRPILEKEKDKLHYFLESKKLSDDDKLLALDFLSDNCSPDLWPLLKKWMISSNSDVQEKAIYCFVK